MSLVKDLAKKYKVTAASTLEIPLGALGSLMLHGSEGKTYEAQEERISTDKIKKELVFVSTNNAWNGCDPALEKAADELSNAADRFFGVLKKYGFIQEK
jgi:hypothetical protein